MNSVTFGEASSSPGKQVSIDACWHHPKYKDVGGSGDDWDYTLCHLSTPVLDVPIVPILMGCEVEIIVDTNGRQKAGQQVVVVGFGDTPTTSRGTKNAVTDQLNAMSGGRPVIYIGETNGVGACPGDSGGPSFVQLADSTWRYFGVHSTGQVCVAAFGVMDWRVDAAVPWIEQQTGLDVTPCHDADGTWNPGPNCKDFPLDPGTGAGQWPSCSPGQLSGVPSATCGPAVGSEAGTGGTGGFDAGVAGAAGDGGAAGSGGVGGDGGGGAAGHGGAAGSGAGGSGGSTGGSGGKATGGIGGTSDAGADAMPASPSATQDEGGCGCRLIRGDHDPTGAAALAAVGWLLARVRRRRFNSKAPT